MPDPTAAFDSDAFRSDDRESPYYQKSLVWDGTWSVKNGIATFTHWHGETNTYNQESLELAIQNVKRNRSAYATYEAFKEHWFHFSRGLSMLKAASDA